MSAAFPLTMPCRSLRFVISRFIYPGMMYVLTFFSAIAMFWNNLQIYKCLFGDGIGAIARISLKSENAHASCRAKGRNFRRLFSARFPSTCMQKADFSPLKVKFPPFAGACICEIVLSQHKGILICLSNFYNFVRI